MDAGSVYPVDPVASVACIVEGDVRLKLHLAQALPATDSVTLRLRSGERVVRARATVTTGSDTVLIEASVPASRLAKGIWRLSLRLGDSAPVRLQARLITSR
jgi:hypothetical protein